VVLGQLTNPVDAAGVYVPGAKGGTTPLVSSVLMGAIPAAIAGVSRVVMVTPPMEDGTINAHLLAAADRVGVTEIYKTGSAWAVAALAHGTKTIAPVDVIVGPGNIYVTLAKKIVSAFVGVDMIAGPSEILVVADETADPGFIAADLLSQAEHDPLSSAILVATSRDLAQSVLSEIQRQMAGLSRKQIAAQSIEDFGAVFVVRDISAALALSNRIAPEHLELQIRDPFAWLSLVKNAGAVFLGAYTPEPVGDYMAGPNHVLPTGGSARFSSALSVDCFVKQSSVVYYSKDAFEREADAIAGLAEIEGLSAHAASMRQRLKS
jgi:histidinol dehydrogenase